MQVDADLKTQTLLDALVQNSEETESVNSTQRSGTGFLSASYPYRSLLSFSAVQPYDYENSPNSFTMSVFLFLNGTSMHICGQIFP